MTNTEKKISEAELHERILDYMGYVLTAARALYKEPSTYGTMRMVDSLQKAMQLLQDAGVQDESVEGPLAVLRENRWQVTSNPEAFTAALDQAISQIVEATLKDKERMEQGNA
jgi:hypothetical protein